MLLHPLFFLGMLMVNHRTDFSWKLEACIWIFESELQLLQRRFEQWEEIIAAIDKFAS